QSGQKEQALEAYIKSYSGGRVESVRRSVIEKLYKELNGSLDGLDQRIGRTVLAEAQTPTTPGGSDASGTTTPQPTSTPEPTPAETTKPEKQTSEPPKSEPTPAPAPAATESSQPASDEALKSAASRLRSTIKITGRVVDAGKTGIADVAVVLISPSNVVLTATTDNQGYYSFKVAPSQKTYRVLPSKDGYIFTPVDRTFTTLFEDLKVVEFVGSRP
ncbi:MAG TPA: carboxypeptidase regulatory-like domain-containing protein, partial [Pyrinomonadaceae bacterium]|nr:carboxypeptidase regulatory-like domain-containing protein [Pyrinomonadaceae bacterium]